MDKKEILEDIDWLKNAEFGDGNARHQRIGVALELLLAGHKCENMPDERPIVPESWVCSCGQKISQEVMEYRIRCQVCNTIYRGEPCDGQAS